MKKSIFCLSLAVFAVSCAKEINPGASEQNLAPMQFEISVEATKTALASDGKSVNWIDGDKVAIFDGGTTAKEFTVTGSTLSGSADPEAADYYAVYPYDGAAMSDNVFTSSIASQQIVTAGSMADDCAVLIAKAEDDKLYFKNVTALVKFTLDVEGVRSLTLIGNNNEQIAGKFYIDWNNGDPVATSTSPEVTVTLRDASSADGNEAADLDLAKGDYYFTILPVKFEKGFSVILGMNDGTQKIVNRSSGLELDRNEIFRTQAVPASAYKAHASNFVKYNDGFAMTYDCITVNRASYGYATYVSDGRPNIEKEGFYFVDSNANNVTSAFLYVNNNLLIAGDNPNARSKVNKQKGYQPKTNETGFIVLANLDIETGTGAMLSNSSKFTSFHSFVMIDCKLNSQAQFIASLSESTSKLPFTLDNLVIADSDILLNYTSSKSHYGLVYLAYAGYNVNNIVIRNNAVESKSSIGKHGRVLYVTNVPVYNLIVQNNTFKDVCFGLTGNYGMIQAPSFSAELTVGSNFFVNNKPADVNTYLVCATEAKVDDPETSKDETNLAYVKDKTNIKANIYYVKDLKKTMEHSNLVKTGNIVPPSVFSEYPLIEGWSVDEGVFGYRSGLKYCALDEQTLTLTERGDVSAKWGAKRTANLNEPSVGYGDNNNGSL